MSLWHQLGLLWQSGKDLNYTEGLGLRDVKQGGRICRAWFQMALRDMGRKEAVLLTKRKYEEVGRELSSRQTGFQQLQQANKVARSCQWRGTDQKSREKLPGGIRS